MSDRGQRTLRRLAALILVGLALVLGELALASHVPGSIDDLFILLVYARNLLAGHGFRYHPDGPAVEGFTSLLDLLWKALALRVAPADPIRAAWFATTIAYGAALLLAVRLAWRAAAAGRVAGGRVAWVLPGVVALSLTPGLAEGSTYLLGTPLHAVTLLVLLAVAERPREGGPREVMVAVAAFAVVLARPEGLLPATVVLALRAWPRTGAARFAAPLAFAVLCGGLFAWRFAVFGQWAPNSYFAKTSSVRWNEVRDGAAYVAMFARTLSGGALLAGAAGLALALWRGRWVSESARAACLRAVAAGVVALGGVVWSGGDCYLGARFLAPVALLILAALSSAVGGLRGIPRIAVCGALLLSAFGQLRVVLPHAGAKLRALGDAPLGAPDFACERDLCRRLAEALPGARIAQHDLQCLAWFAPEVHVLDTSGINAPRIARLPAAEPVRFGRDGLWIALEEKIELIHLDFQRTRPEPWSRVPLTRLLGERTSWNRFVGGEPYTDQRAAGLLAHYLPASVPVGTCGSGRWLNVLVRAEHADALRRAGFEVGER